MTAPIMYEPSDAPELPLVPVSPDKFDRLATTLGAGPVERDGALLVVAYNGRAFVTEATRVEVAG